MGFFRHQLSGRFCPYCMQPLKQCVERPEIEYCSSHWDICDYEVHPTGKQPLSAAEYREELLKQKRDEFKKLSQRCLQLQNEIAELLKL